MEAVCWSGGGGMSMVKAVKVRGNLSLTMALTIIHIHRSCSQRRHRRLVRRAEVLAATLQPCHREQPRPVRKDKLSAIRWRSIKTTPAPAPQSVPTSCFGRVLNSVYETRGLQHDRDTRQALATHQHIVTERGKKGGGGRGGLGFWWERQSSRGWLVRKVGQDRAGSRVPAACSMHARPYIGTYRCGPVASKGDGQHNKHGG